MQHTITLDGHRRDLDIRPMDESFVVYRKMFVPPLMPDSIGDFNPGGPRQAGFRIVEEFFRRQVRVLGSCMILAWDGNGVVAKMPFTTREVYDAIGGPERYDDSPSCYCIDHNGFGPRLQEFADEELARLLSSPSRTLRLLCFNVGCLDRRYHGQGIAKAMVECLKSWARERQWRRIEAYACPDIIPPNLVGDWLMRRGPLERLGFRALEAKAVPPEQARARLRAIESLATGQARPPDWADWYARNFPRLLADPSWRDEYANDYTMACDLERPTLDPPRTAMKEPGA